MPDPSVTISPSNQADNRSYASILDVLVAQKVIDQATADKILASQLRSGEPLENEIAKQVVLTEEVLLKAKSVFFGIPYVNLAETGIFPEAIGRLPEGVARHYGVLPFAYDPATNVLSVAMKNPLDVMAIDFIRQQSATIVKAYYALTSEIDRFIAENYAQGLSGEVSAAIAQTVTGPKEKVVRQDAADLANTTLRQAPVAKIVQTILSFALKARASDVHIEPQEMQTRVRYRIDGILTEKLILPKSVHDALVSRIKILAGLKIDEKRMPQDGRFDFTENDQQVDLRISTMPTIHGEKVVMRLLQKNAQVPSLEELGLVGLALKNMKDAIKVPHGIILVTGPTGSGKTTTLYSVLHTINSPRVNIMTLEDPVEYQMPGVNQIQVNPAAGLTFASGLRSFLRQDPNVIMVGEIRDGETAGLAVQASLTGHLVFATLHTSSAAGAIPRLIDMGAEPFLLASCMTMVIAQRIARKINPDFSEEYTPEPAVMADIKQVLGNQFDIWLKQKGIAEKDIKLRRAAANRPEIEPEYKGRIAIFEVMKITPEISRLVMESRPSSEMENVAMTQGMLLMKQDGYLKVLDGITTIEEVLRVAEI